MTKLARVSLDDADPSRKMVAQHSAGKRVILMGQTGGIFLGAMRET